MKYRPDRKIKILCRKVDRHLIPKILADAYRIAKHINAMPSEIKLNPYGQGGLYQARRGDPITVGIQLGYNKWARTTLVHEMLHIKGYSHGLKRNGTLFMSGVHSKDDTFSQQVEKEIFDGEPYVFV